jgi:hypothetical protein
MDDEITRKRLKKKVLDRWENEGGRIVADPAGSDEGGPKKSHRGEHKRPSGSRGKAPAGAPPTPTKKRKPAEE